MTEEKLYAQSRLQGFTLIELLVVITITGLFFGGAIAGFGSFRNKQTQNQDGLTMKNILRAAQGKAFNGDKFGCTRIYPNDGLVGWFVDINAKTMYGMCGNQIFGTTSFQLLNQSGITSTVNPISFTTIPKGASAATVCVANPNASGSFRIQVSAAGDISDTPVVNPCP